jgi:hypothetical protein
MYSRNEIVFKDKKNERVFRPWWELEEYQPDGGMWKIATTTNKKQMIENAVMLLRLFDTDFAAACKKVISEWPLSCYQTFTTNAMNQIAWLGQAACFITHGSVEETTRLAWHQLNADEQKRANEIAKTAIENWKFDNNEKGLPHQTQQLSMFGETPNAKK